MKMWSGVILPARGSLAAPRAQTLTSDVKIGDKLIDSRYVMVETSPTSYTEERESSEDGQSWTAWMEMKATKAPAKK